ncbi:MAG: 30S ribosomal protein S19e [Candidatus Aenigmatarchaeota archaeon]
MVNVYDVDPQKFVERLKEELKKIDIIKPPKWVLFAKSSSANERPPEQEDFWYIRAASILRRLYIDGEIGVRRLRTYYGKRKQHKRKREKFRKAGGKIIRAILQQLENAGFVEKIEKRGRKLTNKGISFLDRIAYEVYKSSS